MELKYLIQGNEQQFTGKSAEELRGLFSGKYKEIVADEALRELWQQNDFPGIIAHRKFPDKLTELLFQNVVSETRALVKIGEYEVTKFSSKQRPYRYFDTFEGRLTANEIAAYIGPLEETGVNLALRNRGDSYVLTVKFPTPDGRDREEHEFGLPSDADFYALNPEDFHFWEPIKRAKSLGQGRPLQEVLQLVVNTNRFDLYQDGVYKAEIALDHVVATGSGGVQRIFCELEVECKQGTEQDAVDISSYFLEHYHNTDIVFLRSQLPKFVKARRLLRNEDIKPDS